MIEPRMYVKKCFSDLVVKYGSIFGKDKTMTDKQIIIDEVKCPWFNDGSCDLFYSDKEECWYRKCKDTPNCYYRETQTQLKAKEQECEELKKKVYKYEQAEKYPAAFLWQEGLL